MAKKKFIVNCWCRVGKIIDVESDSKEEAEAMAQSIFEDEDLNKCEYLDSGFDIVEESKT